MPNYVLARYIGHDASVAIVGEGRILHFELERFTGRKHDGGEVTQLYEPALAQFGIAADDITAVVGLSGSLPGPPVWTDMNDIYERLTSFGGRAVKSYVVPHHTGHAAYAFYTSPFESASLLAMDGGGDAFKLPVWPQPLAIDTAVGTARHPFGSTSGEFTVRWVPQQFVGAAWITASQRWFHRENAEGSVMALAGVVPERFESTGHPLSDREELQRLQAFTNDRFRDLVPAGEPAAMAGGCALNGVAVYDLLRSGHVPSVHVPPAVHDGGLTVGGALLVLHHVLGEPRYYYPPETVAFAGHAESALEGNPPVDEIADALANGQVVALAYGQAESGPRALGHRSLLGDPRPLAMKDRLNRIKGREAWRPVAPVILREHAGRHCAPGRRLLPAHPYHFMTCICAATDRAMVDLPAAIHDDGTMRVQVIDTDHSLGPILRAFHDRTGCPALLNTSFNLAGQAMVNTAADAEATFRKAPEIDLLAVGERVIRR